MKMSASVNVNDDLQLLADDALISALNERVLIEHGGPSGPKFGWNLCKSDSRLHVAAIAEILRLRSLVGEAREINGSDTTTNSNAGAAAERDVKQASDALKVALDRLRIARGESTKVDCHQCHGSGWDELERVFLGEFPGPVRACDGCCGIGTVADVYPMVITKIATDARATRILMPHRKKTSWVAVKQVGDDDRTYLGVLLGNLAQWVQASRDECGVLSLFPCGHNPAMFVPDLGKVVMGCESWWRSLTKPEDLRCITDQDIGGAWYVRALTELSRDAT